MEQLTPEIIPLVSDLGLSLLRCGRLGLRTSCLIPVSYDCCHVGMTRYWRLHETKNMKLLDRTWHRERQSTSVATSAATTVNVKNVFLDWVVFYFNNSYEIKKTSIQLLSQQFIVINLEISSVCRSGPNIYNCLSLRPSLTRSGQVEWCVQLSVQSVGDLSEYIC